MYVPATGALRCSPRNLTTQEFKTRGSLKFWLTRWLTQTQMCSTEPCPPWRAAAGGTTTPRRDKEGTDAGEGPPEEEAQQQESEAAAGRPERLLLSGERAAPPAPAPAAQHAPGPVAGHVRHFEGLLARRPIASPRHGEEGSGGGEAPAPARRVSAARALELRTPRSGATRFFSLRGGAPGGAKGAPCGAKGAARAGGAHPGGSAAFASDFARTCAGAQEARLDAVLRAHATRLAAQSHWRLLGAARAQIAALEATNAALAGNPGRAWAAVQLAEARERERALREGLSAAQEALAAAGVRVGRVWGAEDGDCELSDLSSMGSSSISGSQSRSIGGASGPLSTPASASAGDSLPSVTRTCSAKPGAAESIATVSDGTAAAEVILASRALVEYRHLAAERAKAAAAINLALCEEEERRRGQRERISALEARLRAAGNDAAVAATRLAALREALEEALPAVYDTADRALLGLCASEVAGVCAVLEAAAEAPSDSPVAPSDSDSDRSGIPQPLRAMAAEAQAPLTPSAAQVAPSSHQSSAAAALVTPPIASLVASGASPCPSPASMSWRDVGIGSDTIELVAIAQLDELEEAFNALDERLEKLQARAANRTTAAPELAFAQAPWDTISTLAVPNTPA